MPAFAARPRTSRAPSRGHEHKTRASRRHRERSGRDDRYGRSATRRVASPAGLANSVSPPLLQRAQALALGPRAPLLGPRLLRKTGLFISGAVIHTLWVGA